MTMIPFVEQLLCIKTELSTLIFKVMQGARYVKQWESRDSEKLVVAGTQLWSPE